MKTLKKYLGNHYNIAATVGHIKDLPEKELGIEIEDGFKPVYKTIPGKQKVVTALKKSAGESEDIYLAPDPDREGEAIAWHTADILKKKGRRFHRVLFHELTKNAIEAAMSAPEALDKDRYEAQQARRILDRLVGYEVSPLLWQKVKRGLSAGRVQSVAVRIICDREREIHAFVPEEYWSITAYLRTEDSPVFTAKLIKKNKEKIGIPDGDTAKAILDELSDQKMIVEKIAKKTTRRNPQPPFTTSKLQQEAINKLRFSARHTMTVAQQLYEGVDLEGGDTVGLITYMRTDSTRIANEAAQEALKLIRDQFGKEYTIPKPRSFKNQKKAQDAHEAIRPTSVHHIPEKMAPYLSKDQLKLYTLIWKRFVASQMAQALIDTVSVTIRSGAYQFSASGSSVKFSGFMVVYMLDDDASDAEKGILPELIEGQELIRDKLEPKQHFTNPPPRFSEASLVKELEEKGIGRPSTYASILSTIRSKGYVELLNKYFRPTELGFIVNDLIVGSFPDIFDVEFTAKMEDELDRVESNEMDWQQVLKDFYDRFKKELDSASESMRSMKADGIPTDLKCPDCDKHLHIKVGRNGHFLACSGYPECTFSTDYTRDEKGKIQPVQPPEQETTDKVCVKCGKPMVVKRGRYGAFLACSGYPDCKHTESIVSGQNSSSTGIACPREKCDGGIVQKKSKRGKVFFGCSKYPECDFATWDKPVDKPCPSCKAKFMVEKNTKKEGSFYACINPECFYKEPIGE